MALLSFFPLYFRCEAIAPVANLSARLLSFYLMGIIAPFLVLSAISGVFSAFAMMCFIPFAMGLFMVLSDGVLHRSLLWWKRGAIQFANGFANGFMFALVSVWFASCSQRAVLSPYGAQ